MSTARPWGWLMAGAGCLGAIALTLPGPEPTAPATDRPAPAPGPVLQMIGLAAPTAAEALPADEPALLRADIDALARRWQTLAAAPGSPAERALWRDSLARLQPWLARQPQALWAALPRLGEAAPALGQTLVATLLAQDATDGPTQLEALARRWPVHALPLYERLIDRWATQRRHEQAVLTLARAPLDADSRERLLQSLLARWAEVAPDQAARWALSTPGQAPLLAPLHDRWLQQDARSATVFATTLPPGPARQALMEEGLSRWTAQDGPGARDWLRSMAPRPELDAAIAQHASGDELARQAPFEAMDLVARIAQPERRWTAWQALARSLHDIDPDRAAALIGQAPSLSAPERAQLLAEARN